MKPLDFNAKQKVHYAIPTWLRDEQIKQACARVKARVQPGTRNEEPVAVVCFGPSLRDTWEAVKSFKHVISCSGSHKFLVERSIIPTHHVEVDPREHKVGLMGTPQRNTQYLISSTCHPKLFDHLDGFDVKLWHVFDATEDGKRLLPPGEHALTGGCDVGLRSIVMAAFLGFRNVHVFGMDGSAGTVDVPTETRHAAEHPNSMKAGKYDIVEYDGVTYYTTPGMLEATRQLHHELDQIPAIKPVFYGNGLAQHMMRNYTPKTEEQPTDNVVAFSKPELISTEYRALNAQLHQSNLAYGVGGGRHVDMVLKLHKVLKGDAPSVLDYGAGKGYLAKGLPFPIWEYDPAVAEKAETPRPADLVVCTDVLEHIEPDKLFFVLDDLRRCVKQVGYFTIHMGPAKKTLPDGRNTHLIQQNQTWWTERLTEFFHVGKIFKNGPELVAVVGPKGKK